MGGGVADGVELGLRGGAEDGDGEGQAAGEVPGGPFDDLAAFGGAEFGDFGGEAKHRHAAAAALHAEFGLAAHQGAVEPVMAIEEGVEDRPDAGEGRGHGQEPRAGLPVPSTADARPFSL